MGSGCWNKGVNSWVKAVSFGVFLYCYCNGAVHMTWHDAVTVGQDFPPWNVGAGIRV